MMETEKTIIYFASDLHLGADFEVISQDRERFFVSWLEAISESAHSLFLVGDIFDYWFEYKYVVPKGYIRLLSKLAQMVEGGTKIHYFKGNHDMWIYDYFQKEIGLIVHNHSAIIELHGSKFHIAHGDGLGQGDGFYKLIKKILRNQFAQSIFALLHPSIGLPLMKVMSRSSREQEMQRSTDHNQKRLIAYTEDLLKKIDFKYFICGHQHFPLIKTLSNKHSIYCNLGDWISHFSYAQFDGKTLELKTYRKAKQS